MIRAISQWLTKNLDLAALLGLLVWLYLVMVSSRHTIQSVWTMLDDSWRVDLVRKAQDHIWIGKQVVFTFGPLYQLSLTVLKSDDGSIGSFLATVSFAAISVPVVALYGASRVFLRGVPAWCRALLLLLLVIFWCPGNLKTNYPVFSALLTICLGEWAKVNRPGQLGFSAGLLCGLGFLVSADAGSYSFAALVIILLVNVLMNWKDRQIIRSTGTFALGSIAALASFSIAVNFWATRTAFDFRYWKAALAIVSVYRWMMPGGVAPLVVRFLVIAPVLEMILICFCIFRIQKGDQEAAQRLVCLTVISGLMLETGVVRSDIGHIALGLFPLIIFAVWSLATMGSFRTVSNRGLASLLLITACCSGPMPPFTLSGMQQQSSVCPSSTAPFSGVCMSLEQEAQFRGAGNYLLQNSPVKSSVAVFPYENLYADVVDRSVAGGVLQNYIVPPGYLSQLQIQGLERDHPEFALYATDQMATVGLDQVPNFQRSPEIWFYLQRWYHRDRVLANGLLGLRRDPVRARDWHLLAEPVPFTTSDQKVVLSIPIKIVDNFPSPRAFDFLRIRLRVEYPQWWRFRKPSYAIAEIRYATGDTDTFRVVLPPNLATDLWLYPWDNRQLLNFFDSNESRWRVERPPIREIWMRFEREDKIAVRPQRVRLIGIDAVRLTLGG